MKKFSVYLLGIFLLSFLLDNILLEIIPKLRLDMLTVFIKYFTILGSGYFVALFIILFLLLTRKKEKISQGILALLLALFVTWAVRILIMRVRPDIALVFKESFSFPSGHATAVFSVYPLLREINKKFSYFWLIFAILILFSRLYLGVHYLSDVIAGALVGLIVGNFVMSKYFKVIEDRCLELIKK